MDGTPSGAAGMAVAYFSVEMSKEQNVMRLLSMISGVMRIVCVLKVLQFRSCLYGSKERTGAVTAHAEYCGSDTIEDMRAKACLCIKKAGWEFIYRLSEFDHIIVSKKNDLPGDCQMFKHYRP